MGGGLAWGSHPMGSGPLLGGRRPCWETSLWVWGRGLTPCPPPNSDEPCLQLRRNVFFPKHKELEVRGGGAPCGGGEGPPPPIW